MSYLSGFSTISLPYLPKFDAYCLDWYLLCQSSFDEGQNTLGIVADLNNLPVPLFVYDCEDWEPLYEISGLDFYPRVDWAISHWRGPFSGFKIVSA